jgi:arylsulfatase
MTDKAIEWARQQKSLMPDKPFFMYFAPGATHAPHHVPTEWSDKYKGRFDQGWDALREEILERQKELGVVPADAELTARHEEIPAWEDMPDELKPVLARQMEVYAGFLEHTDHHVGRLVDALDDLGVLEDTLVYYIIGDNGASAEGTINGNIQRNVHLQRRRRARDARIRRVSHRRARHPDELQPLRGGLGARDGHALPVDETGGIALGRHAQRHDRALAKRVHGARRGANAVPPCDRCRPDRARGRRASAPDLRRRRRPASDRGREHGVLVRPRSEADRRRPSISRCSATAASTTKAGTAVTRHSTPWITSEALPPFDDDVWELYEPGDWSQAHDLAAEMPEKLAELQQLWLEEARKHNVLPLDDRRIERFNAELVGRPELVKGNSQLLFGGMGRLTESSLLNIKNKSHAVTAEIVVPETGAEGVILAQGGAFAGWSLYTKDGRPKYCYNLLGLQRFKIDADATIPPGTHQVRMEFAYDGGGLAKGGTVTLYLDGDQVGEGRVEATVPMIFSADETADVGRDTASAVSDDYDGESSVFTGTVNWVQIDLGEDAEDADHLITPEERLRVAMARQ